MGLVGQAFSLALAGGRDLFFLGFFVTSADRISSASLSSAAALFDSWLREPADLMITTPSAVIRWSFDRSRRAFRSAGNAADPSISNLR